MSELRSKCHGAEVEFIPLMAVRTTYEDYHVPNCYRAECLKCGKPTEVEEKEEATMTEEWIEEKARRLIEGISLNDIQSLEGWKDFIRSLVGVKK